MKKLLLALVACVVAFSASAWTVKFTNPDGWSEVCVWAWDDAGVNYTGGNWPGMPMTKSGDVWTYAGEGNPTKIIFNNNNNGKQTGDLSFVDNATYDMYGPVGTATQDYTVYFDNSKSNWAQVYVYTFNPEGAGAWPGTKLSAGANGLYAWTYRSASTPTFGGIIFNNGDGAQTDDLTYQAGATYTSEGLSSGGGSDTPVDPTPNPGTDKTLYVVGAFNDWSAETGIKMNHEAGTNVYTLTSSTAFGGEWKICDGTWAWNFGMGDSLVEGINNDAWFDGQNFSAISGNVTVTFTLVEGSDFKDCGVPSIVTYTTGGGSDTPVDPNPNPNPGDYPSTLYIIGNVNGAGWATNQGTPVSGDNGVYTFTNVTIDDAGAGVGYFAFCTVLSTTADDWDTVNSGNRYGAPAENTPIALGESATMRLYAVDVDASASQSWMITAGKYDIVANVATMTVTIKAAGSGSDTPVDPNPNPNPNPNPGDYPSTLYIIGNVNGAGWATNQGTPATGDNGVYTFNNVTIDDAGAGVGYFAFCTVLSTTTNDWDTVNSGNRYGAPAENTPIALDESKTMRLYAVDVDASGSQSWMIAAGQYDIVANIATMTVSVKSAGTTGVASFEAADGEAEYYNLQGQKVANPEKGIFIKVLNGKAVKVVK